MKKRKKILTKISLFFALALLCIISFVVPTNAYYLNDNGNLISENLFENEFNYSTTNFSISTINQTTTIYGVNNNVTFLDKSVYLESGDYYLSIQNSTDSNNTGLSVFTEINNVRYYSNFTIETSGDYSIFMRVELTSSVNYSFNIMLNKGTSALNYEPYGNYYSETNYENYGSSQYAQGYTDGYNSIYNNLVDVNLSQQINGFGLGIYDSTGETFLQRATISSSGFENNYYYINFNSLVNNYYVLNIGFNDTYLINNFSIQTANVSNPSLEANGYVLGTSSTYTYNGTTYGWHSISFNEPVNLVTFRFQNTRDLTELKLYINGKRLNVLDSLESYNEGLENGKEIGYNNGYTDGYSQGSKDNTEITSSGFKVLFNSILSYPVNFFKEVFNFEFMGINIAALITFIISLVIVGFIWNKFRK